MRRQIALPAVLVSFVLVAGLAARQSSAPEPPQRPPVFRSGAAFVRVDVYPIKDGRIVPGLKREDFELFEDGKPQQIESFDFVDFPTFASEEERRDPATKEEGEAMAADPRNRVFVIYLDTFHVSVTEAYYMRPPLVALLDRTIGASDVFAVATPRQTYASLVFGRKVQGLEDMLARNWPWGLSDDPDFDETAQLLAACYGDEPFLPTLIKRERLDRTLGGIRELVDYLGRFRQERKNLMIFTHGWDLEGPADSLVATADARVPLAGLGRGRQLGANTPGAQRARISAACDTERLRLAGTDFRDRFRELLEAAKRANVSFYPVNPAGLSADPAVISKELRQRSNAIETAGDRLRELAANTDGIAVVDTNDLRSAMTRITDSLSAYYLLGYYPTNAKQDDTLRSIVVKGPKGLDLKARRQYLASDEREEAARRSRAVPATPVATAGAVPELDAAFATLARNTASRSEITATAAITSRSEIVLVAEAARPATADTDIQLIVSDAAGNAAASGRGRLTAGTRSVSIRAPLSAGSTGPWQAVMRISGGDLRGGETIPVEMPTGLVGNPLVQRIDSAGASPVANPVFPRRERLRATWTTLGAAEVTTRTARVLDRRGQPLPIDAVVTTTPSGARTAIAVDVALSPLAPGDYVVELIVSASGTETRRLLAFRVTQ